MLKSHGMVLKGRKPISLGQMPSVSGFGEQAQIGDAQLLNQMFFILKGGFVRTGIYQRMDEKQQRSGNDAHGHGGQIYRRLSHFLFLYHRDTEN